MHRTIISATLVFSSLGLCTPQAEACLFKHCRQRRQVTCWPSQAPAMSTSVPQAYGGGYTIQDQVNYLYNVTVQGQQFTDPNSGQTVVIPRQQIAQPTQ